MECNSDRSKECHEKLIHHHHHHRGHVGQFLDLASRLLAGPGSARRHLETTARVVLLFSAALRRSEISGLDYLASGSGDGYLTITAEAIEIVLLRSKSRTEPTILRVPRAENPGLLAALERWIALAAITSG